jgi:putative transposase
VIGAEKANCPVAWMCRLLGVPRSSFYAWRNGAETPAAARRRELAAHVCRVFAAGRGAYGCRRVTAQLNREGHPCSVGLVADLMRETGLRACQPQAYKRPTIPGKQPVSRPDLIGRDFTAEEPGTRMVGDITYLRTGQGWLYLSVTWNHSACRRVCAGLCSVASRQATGDGGVAGDGCDGVAGQVACAGAA